MLTRTLVSVLIVSGVMATAASADWSRFRGPNGSGVATDGASTPVTWGASANVKWKTALPGAGVSCPIIVGDRVYVTCYSGYGLDRENPGDMSKLKRHVVAVDRATGSIAWNKTIDAVLPEDPYEGIGVPAHGYASSTPVSDGQNVYVFFGKTGALAFDPSGKQLWHTNLGKESDPRKWGSASSPILYKNYVIVPATAESESLVALDKSTGKEVWRAEASGFANSWCTPILVNAGDGRTDLVIGVTDEVWGFNPDNGKLRWYAEGAKAGSYCSSLVSQDGVAYSIEGRSGKSMAIKVGGKGDVTTTHVAWTGKDSARFGSPIIHENRLFSCANGIATVIDATTGKKIKQARMRGGQGGAGGRMGGDYSSPILADGKLYYVRQSGDFFVLKADDTLEQLAVNRLATEDEEFSATPSVAGGELFVRSNKTLYCVAKMGQTVPAGEQVAIAEVADDDGEGERGGRDGRGRGGRRRMDPEQMFKDRDTNGDGKLSREELPERMRGAMDDMDKDKDGSLSKQELTDGMRNFRGRGRGGRGGRGGGESDNRPKRPARPALEV